MESDFVAIIILNLNRKADLLECIQSIYKMEYKSFEIIIVDNGSTDGSLQEIEKGYAEIHLIKNKKNLGVAGGRNAGIKYANEKLNYNSILFLDNDVIVESDFLTEMIKSLNTGNDIGIVTPKCYLMNSQNIIGYAGGMNINLFTGSIYDIGGGEVDNGQFNISKYVNASGGIFLVKKNILNEIGIFDEQFNPYGWEDVDFSIRARRKGYKILYCPKAVVHHKGGKKGRIDNISEYESSKVKNYFYLVKKHANVFQIITIYMLLPFKVLYMFIKDLLNGEYKFFALKIRGLLNLVRR